MCPLCKEFPSCRATYCGLVPIKVKYIYFSDVWSEYYCLARGNHFCSQSFLLLVSEEKFVWLSEEEGVTYVCLCCVISSLSVVGYIKGGWRWWRWSRSKGVVKNSFHVSQFRRCHAGLPIYSGFGKLLISLTLYFLGTQMNYETLL